MFPKKRNDRFISYDKSSAHKELDKETSFLNGLNGQFRSGHHEPNKKDGQGFKRDLFIDSKSNKNKNQITRKKSDEDPALDEPRILVSPRGLETQLCDLAFINEDDKESAQKEYIRINRTDELEPNLDPKFAGIRSKRSLPKIRTIETAIFVDRHLNQRFNGRIAELKRLVLSIMNEVQLIYNYQTMKTPIKIVVVKFEILKQGQSGPNNAGGDIDKYLDNFCAWQARKHRAEDLETRWDHALMLTGLDLYKDAGSGKKNKKVLGLAWVNGMCKPSYSCTLNEGKSFEAAFVIAHEMGHSLGILHDGRGNNCDPDKFIMSEKTGPGKVNWSACSNVYLENFLSKGHGRCMDDSANPIPELNFQRVSRLPGEQYTPNMQCQLALGAQYKAYLSAKEPFNNICRELWCLSGSWATPAHPALEGSACGRSDEKCFQGSCREPGSSAVQLSRYQQEEPVKINQSSSTVTVTRRSVPTIRNKNRNRNRVRPSNSKTRTRNRVRGSRYPIVSTPLAKPSANLKINSAAATAAASTGEKPLMDSIKGFIRSITDGAQGFLEFFKFG